jgi:hypothetical protein
MAQISQKDKLKSIPSMQSLKALEVRRVSSSENLLHPGEYVFIEKRQPKITLERTPLTPPQGFFNRLYWNWFGKKYELKKIVELVWPDYDVAIINCPECNVPMASTQNHKIVSVEPLTIETPLNCPYCKNVTFAVREGKILAI